MDKRYDPAINSRLQSLAKAADWQAMLAYLHSLSNASFRTASYILAERILPQMEGDDYWSCFCQVALTDRKAFLMTFLKAAKDKYLSGTLCFNDKRFLDFGRSTAAEAVSLDRQKTLRTVLPILRSSAEVAAVLDAFCGRNYERQLGYLVTADESMPCYLTMFQTMRRMDYDTPLLTKSLALVLKRSTPLAFNFVSVMRCYFGIEQLRGQFSLTLQPYELSRMESGYDGFTSIMTKIK